MFHESTEVAELTQCIRGLACTKKSEECDACKHFLSSLFRGNSHLVVMELEEASAAQLHRRAEAPGPGIGWNDVF